MTEEPSYRAFISYSHVNVRFAAKLQNALESYRFPKPFTRTDTGAKRRIRPVFRDKYELSAAESLSDQLIAALAASQALIVVASPAARASKWVQMEIDMFRTLCPTRPIYIALVEGEPEAVLPPELLQDQEPIAADFRKNGDGWRLALLKLIAGLEGLKLNALLQREQQKKLKSVMAVTLFAAALVLILTLLLLLAIRAERKAEQQRIEAEGVVEFMLTDLRDRLQGAGRLDIMSSVNTRALQHYISQDISNLPEDSLNRRARLLRLMGQDAANKGELPQARNTLNEAQRTSSALVEAHPYTIAYRANLGLTAYWLGYLDFLAHDKSNTEKHWLDYYAQETAILKQEPENDEAQLQLADAVTDLCAAALEKPVEIDKAFQYCKHTVEKHENYAAKHPQDMKAQLELSTSYGWLAEVYIRDKDWRKALVQHKKALDIVNRIFSDHVTDVRILYKKAVAEHMAARALSHLGRVSQSNAHLQTALQLINKLLSIEPKQTDWQELKSMILRLTLNNGARHDPETP
jgi:tetratricopeptide (TPR) repeat protein